MIDGTQAEYVRTPYADNSLVPLPDNVNEEVALLLSDALPTAHEIGVQYGDVKPGDTVFIAGAGPVGMSALLLRNCIALPPSSFAIWTKTA